MCKGNVNKFDDYLGYFCYEVYGKDSTQTMA
jgi:hypothetical protein